MWLIASWHLDLIQVNLLSFIAGTTLATTRFICHSCGLESTALAKTDHLGKTATSMIKLQDVIKC